MKKLALLAAAAAVNYGAAYAADECIENAAGQVVCGQEAENVRARMQAEERLTTPGMDEPAGVEPEEATFKTPRLKGAQGVQKASARTGGDDCVENVAGNLVCGADASAVKARIEAEDRADYADAAEVPPPRAARRSGGSVYSAYGPSVFLRGGYIFAGSGSFEAPTISFGYSRYFNESGRSHFGYETELLYLRDSEDFLLLGVPTELTTWGLVGLINLRWQYDLADSVKPFASAGIGPSYFRAKLDDGTTVIADGDFTVAYSGRAGVAFPLSDQFSFETAYRYLGTTQSGTPGFHSAEIGLNYEF